MRHGDGEVALLFVSARPICFPADAQRLAGHTVSRYSLTDESIATVRALASARPGGA